MRSLPYILAVSLAASTMQAAFVHMDLDSNSTKPQSIEQELFSGDNPLFKATLTDMGIVVNLTNPVSVVTLGYARTPVTSGYAQITGSVATTNVVTFADTNVFANPGTYQWYVLRSWTEDGNSITKTYGQGGFTVSFGRGNNATLAVFTIPLNWAPFTYLNTATHGPYRAGTGITSVTGADGSETHSVSNGLITQITSNTTHRTSDGSDHGFIDQPVTNGASPTFDGANFTGIPASGITEADPIATNAFIQTQSINGFANRTATTLSFNESTRVMTLAPTGATFKYWYQGQEVIGATTKTATISDTEGLHFIYINADGTLTNSTTVTTADFIKTHVAVGTAYWNADDDEEIYCGEERHGINMSSATHYHWHDTLGASYESGLALSDFDIDGSGNDDSAARFSVGSGEIHDEDLSFDISASATDRVWPVYYFTNSTWRIQTNAAPVLSTDFGTDRLAYNDTSGGQLVEISNNQFVLAHIFAINDTNRQVIAIAGQNDYTTIVQARQGAPDEMNNLVTVGLPILEAIPIATVIYQTSTGYGNLAKGRTRTTDQGDNYVDFRGTALTGSAAPGEHNQLAGIDGNGTIHLSATETGLVYTAIQKDGSVTWTGDDNHGGSAITNVSDIQGTGDLTMDGESQLGDAATDNHGINTAPATGAMLNSVFTPTETTGSLKGYALDYNHAYANDSDGSDHKGIDIDMDISASDGDYFFDVDIYGVFIDILTSGGNNDWVSDQIGGYWKSEISAVLVDGDIIGLRGEGVIDTASGTGKAIGLFGTATNSGASGGAYGLWVDEGDTRLKDTLINGNVDMGGNVISNAPRVYLNTTDYWYTDGTNAIWSDN